MRSKKSPYNSGLTTRRLPESTMIHKSRWRHQNYKDNNAFACFILPSFCVKYGSGTYTAYSYMQLQRTDKHDGPAFKDAASHMSDDLMITMHKHSMALAKDIYRR